MRREELKTYEAHYQCTFVKCYAQDEADKVMDAMKRRIARLTALVEALKKNSVVLGEMYHKRLAQEQARIKKLEAKTSEDYISYQRKAQKQAKRIAELESENSRLKSIVGDEEYKEGLSGLAQRNAELREENERLKAANFDLQSHFDVLKEDYDEVVSKLGKVQVPKWISVKDRLPFAMERVLVCTTRGTFASATHSPLTNSWIEHGQLFGKITHWMPLPPPPTEESSATEKEN